MALDSYLVPFMLLKVFCIIDPLWKLPNKMCELKKKHQHILNVGRAPLYQSKLPASYWSYALLHATFIINKVTSPPLHNKSPYLLLHAHIPDITSFKVFGSLCYSTTLQGHKSKLSPRARKSIFLGYSVGFKGLVLLDLQYREIHISRHVIFHEHMLPYPSNPSSITTTYDYFPSDACLASNLPTYTPNTPTISPPPIIDPDPPAHTSNPPTPPISPPIRKCSRTTHPPSHLKDYVCNISSSSFLSLSDIVKYPISQTLSYVNVSPSHCANDFSIASNNEPFTYVEASKHSCWQQAMKLNLHILRILGHGN